MRTTDSIRARVGENVRVLRESRGATQQQLAKLAGIPRATWSNLESGDANPTLEVLHRVALALQVSLEELAAPPRSAVKLYPRGTLPSRLRGQVTVSRLLPDVVPGMEMDRMELPPRAHLAGVPHTPGTREYLTCETGELVLHAGGEQFRLRAGDVLAFRGDQKHAYLNPGERTAVGYSVVVLSRA